MTEDLAPSTGPGQESRAARCSAGECNHGSLASLLLSALFSVEMDRDRR